MKTQPPITDAASAIEDAIGEAFLAGWNAACDSNESDHPHTHELAFEQYANTIRALPIAPAQADPGVEARALLDAATDALDFLRGDISGSSQKDGIIRELDAAITAALARPAHGELVAALEKFLAKWDQVEPAINNAFAIQHFHGMPYSGPTIETELAELRSALGAGGE